MMKLYVWEDVFYNDGPGIAFAIAESADAARVLVLKKIGYSQEDRKSLETHWAHCAGMFQQFDESAARYVKDLSDDPAVYPVDQPYAFACSGYNIPYDP